MKVTVNGIDIRYEAMGSEESPVLLFVHGFPFDHTVWQPQMEALRKAYRVIAFDLRGHGDSGMGEEAFSMTLFADDLLAFMDALGIDNAVICAHSMGGYIALNAMKRHPERFRALILCDTQCAADTDAGRIKRAEAIRAIEEKGVASFAEALLGKLFSEVSLETCPDMVDGVRKLILRTDPIVLQRALAAMRDRDETCSTLQAIRVPVLILVGEKDLITPVETAAYLHENILNAHLTIIEQAGHMCSLESPDAFNAALERFLKTL